MILTVDLGTSVTKVVVWGDDGPVAVGRSALRCTYSAGNRVEQDPGTWWPSVVDACQEARAEMGARAGAILGAVGALGFAAARQTFVPVAADATPLGPALVWSDRRAATEAFALAQSFGEEGADVVRRRTGVVLDAGSVAAKFAWLEHNDPATLRAARWLLAPRDLMAWRLIGDVTTDQTLASATGLFEMSDGGLGPLLPGLADVVADLLPDAVPSDTVVGGLLGGPAEELGLAAGIPVVIGAGDRACEVLGAGSSEAWPMVSWGTTANVSVPVRHRLEPPRSVIVTRGALGGWLLEGGLSAAGSLVDWLARLGGVDAASLMGRARSSPPGARGVIALPWLGGARAPWWRDTARGAVVGLSFDHDIGDMARAVVESVAWDVKRCLESVTEARTGTGTGTSRPEGLVLGGGGASVALWPEILTAVTGLRAFRRRSGEAASAGAAILAAKATGVHLGQGAEVRTGTAAELRTGAGGGAGAADQAPHLDADLSLFLERVDPVDAEISPDATTVACYEKLRPAADAAAAAVIELGR
ncbi:MAG TPA: FGGY family carbohydrate kinase [Acidimicrobiales bacterium]|nr:FGGY family carbohydrate kinase [Acidimicrobiales bacterium]